MALRPDDLAKIVLRERSRRMEAEILAYISTCVGEPVEFHPPDSEWNTYRLSYAQGDRAPIIQTQHATDFRRRLIDLLGDEAVMMLCEFGRPDLIDEYDLHRPIVPTYPQRELEAMDLRAQEYARLPERTPGELPVDARGFTHMDPEVTYGGMTTMADVPTLQEYVGDSSLYFNYPQLQPNLAWGGGSPYMRSRPVEVSPEVQRFIDAVERAQAPRRTEIPTIEEQEQDQAEVRNYLKIPAPLRMGAALEMDDTPRRAAVEVSDPHGDKLEMDGQPFTPRDTSAELVRGGGKYLEMDDVAETETEGPNQQPDAAPGADKGV